MSATRDTEPRRWIDWGSGGWVILGALLLVLIAVVWRVSSWTSAASAGASGAIGDGRHADTYGFDLDSWDPAFPRDALVGSGQPRDGIPALTDPTVMTRAEVEAFNGEHRGKYLVGEDLVIGLAIDGQARAYPLRLLNWHEVVNDRLGGRAIAVSYSPLSDSAVAFDRSFDGVEVEFGVSGLLLNSNTVLYDRRPDGTAESLWSQLAARAIAGPQRGTRWTLLSLEVARWDAWCDRHPETTVVRPDTSRLKRYQRNPYGSYLMTGRLRFPVLPEPAEQAPPAMAPAVVVGSGSDSRVIDLTAGAESSPWPVHVQAVGPFFAVRVETALPVRTTRRFAADALIRQ